MSFKLHLILELRFSQIRCNVPDISFLSETQKKLSILIITTCFLILSPKNYMLFVCVSLRYEMSFKLHLSLELWFSQIRCNVPDISFLSETQKKLSILIITSCFLILSPKN